MKPMSYYATLILVADEGSTFVIGETGYLCCSVETFSFDANGYPEKVSRW
jgi:hypothetical protein